ncbi:MAG: anti-sigma factor antagonist [Peptostreptococcaceae bacterium]
MVKCFMQDKTLIVEFEVFELDHHITNEVRDKIDYILNTKKIIDIIFDFEKIRFMDSSGIGVIIGRYKKIASEGGKVSIIGANERVRKIFELSGMTNIINICDKESISSL